MYARIRKQFSPAALVISVIALVLALVGGAIAASSDGGNATASAKGKRGPRGPKGPKGAKGDTGATGAKGDKGDPGANGSNGTNGTDGEDGIDGASVTGAAIGAGGACGTETGVKYTLSATSTNVCNGIDGEDGETGFTSTLPSGETETGNWSAISFFGPEAFLPFGTISYSIPLAAPSGKVVFLNQAQTEESTTTPVEGCELEVGNPAFTPVAPPDTLCIFTREEELGTFKFVGENAFNKGDSTYGALIWFETTEISAGIGAVRWRGSWAVTAK